MQYFQPDTPEVFRATADGQVFFHPKAADLLSDPSYWQGNQRERTIAAHLFDGAIHKAQASAYRATLVELYKAAGIDVPDQFDPTVETSRLVEALRSKKKADAVVKKAARKPRVKRVKPAPQETVHEQRIESKAEV